MRPVSAFALLVGLVGVSACRPSADPSSPAAGARADLPTPAGPGSRSPQLAAGDGRLLLSWVEPSADSSAMALRFATFDGTAWSAPQTASEGPDWFVNAADMPGVTPLPGGALAAHWLVRGPGAGYGLRVSRSDDGGRTWTPPVTPHRDGTPAEHGFARVFPWAGGRTGLIWLDGRKYFQTSATRRSSSITLVHGGDSAHAHAQETALRFAALGSDGTLTDEGELDARTCDCCQTAAAVTGNGVLVAYRDRSGDEMRDVALVRMAEGRWTPPTIVHRDGWRIDGCPVNGPAVATEGDRVAVAWFTGVGDRPHVRLAFSNDAGATFGPPVEVAGAVPLGRVGVALAGPGSAVVSWMEGPAASATLRLRRVHAERPPEAPVTVAEGLDARTTGFPALARQNEAVVLAWTAFDSTDARPRVRTATWGFGSAP